MSRIKLFSAVIFSNTNLLKLNKMKKCHLLVVIFTILLSSYSFSQPIEFELLRPSFDYLVGVQGSSTAFADIDGDNDQDMLITGQHNSYQYTSRLYSNDGNGNFTEVYGTPFDGVGYGSIAFADVDGDNDLDLLITGENNAAQRISKLYTNDGNGNFTVVSGTPFVGVRYSSIAFADIDGDNDQDVLITGENTPYNSSTKLYTNDGNGNFTEASGTPFVDIRLGSIAFADIDGDNDQDVLITGQGNSNLRNSKLYSNDGNGNFTEVSGTPFIDVRISSIAFADVDGDNDQDVIITGENNPWQYISKLYSNDGNGNFSEVNATPFDGVGYSSIAFADVDSDGDPDVLITGSNSSDQQVANLNINDAQVIIHWLQALLLKTLMLAPKRLPTWIIMAIIIC